MAGLLTSLDSHQPRTVAAQTSCHGLQHVLINRIKPLQGPCARTWDQKTANFPAHLLPAHRAAIPAAEVNGTARLGGGKLPLSKDFQFLTGKKSGSKGKVCQNANLRREV